MSVVVLTSKLGWDHGGWHSPLEGRWFSGTVSWFLDTVKGEMDGEWPASKATSARYHSPPLGAETQEFLIDGYVKVVTVLG